MSSIPSNADKQSFDKEYGVWEQACKDYQTGKKNDAGALKLDALRAGISGTYAELRKIRDKIAQDIWNDNKNLESHDNEWIKTMDARHKTAKEQTELIVNGKKAHPGRVEIIFA